MSNHEEPGAGGQDNDEPEFDLDGMEDAGESALMQASAKAASTAVTHFNHRAQQKALDRAEVYIEADLVKRAKWLSKLECYKFPHIKPPNKDGISQVQTDSLMNRHAVYDALFDFGSGIVPFPHMDLFKARLVDHTGQVFTTKNLKTRTLVMALDAAGLNNPTSRDAAEALHSWALEHERDSLKEFVNKSMPDWDRKERLGSLLLDLFKPFDTPLNRLVDKYFWLSLYNRITRAGSQAPISLALIGAQDIGKSYFSVLLCRLLTGDHELGPVMLDLAQHSYLNFLRDITGQSLVAVVGEMAGFKKGDMLRIKEFMTKTEDALDFKFLDSQIKPRQWITIMDGNGYEGLQRDDTGNRRFYPMFCFQTEDLNGQPTWAKGQKVDFSNFKHDLWQVMAECRVWMAEYGDKGYQALISEANNAVSEFSIGEMSKARGVAKDDNIEINLKPILLTCDFRKIGTNAKNPGFFVASSEINEKFLRKTRREPYSKSLAPHMRAMGFEPKQIGVRGYFIDIDEISGEKEEADMKRDIWRFQSPDTGLNDREVDAEIAAICAAASGGGF